MLIFACTCDIDIFQDLKPTFLKLLEEKLKNKYTPTVAEVWGKTLDVLSGVFQSGVQEFKDNKDEE